MTEKQFTLTMMSRYGHLTGISDGEKDFTTNEIVELLNGQDERIKELEAKINLIADAMLEFEQFFYTKVYEASDK